LAAWLWDGMWQEFGIGKKLKRLYKERKSPAREFFPQTSLPSGAPIVLL